MQSRQVMVGSRSLVLEQPGITEDQLACLERDAALLRAFVLVDGMPAGAIEFADALRPTVRDTLDRLRTLGISRTLLLSGDNPAYVDRVATQLGLPEAYGDLLPKDKLEFIERLEGAGEKVVMVGDGVNDAPALTRADVGVALASHGRGIASESADVVLLQDDIAGVAEGVSIARKTMRVARQSIVAGLGLSIVAMGFAAVGLISPVVGALIQEGIDVAVIINALRTSR